MCIYVFISQNKKKLSKADGSMDRWKKLLFVTILDPALRETKQKFFFHFQRA